MYGHAHGAHGEPVAAERCGESGRVLTEDDRKEVYVLGLPGSPEAVVICLGVLHQLPEGSLLHEQAFFDTSDGLNVYCTVNLQDGTVAIDDLKRAITAETVRQYLPKTAEYFGMVPATTSN